MLQQSHTIILEIINFNFFLLLRLIGREIYNVFVNVFISQNIRPTGVLTISGEECRCSNRYICFLFFPRFDTLTISCLRASLWGFHSSHMSFLLTIPSACHSPYASTHHQALAQKCMSVKSVLLFIYLFILIKRPSPFLSIALRKGDCQPLQALPAPTPAPPPASLRRRPRHPLVRASPLCALHALH